MSESVERKFIVRNELGFHARPASQFVALAGRFQSVISVGNGDEWVDGRSVLSLLSLAASCGATLKIRATGEDAEEAVAALGILIQRSRTEIEQSAAS